ncbi:MAG: pyridoxal-phosphate dependent enzyme [Candidatus Babeliales bacterium]|jgi:D-cysteine desulfhydrase
MQLITQGVTLKNVLIPLFFAVGILNASETRTADDYLFKAFPALKEHVGYVSLGTFPTPVQKLEKLGSMVGHPNLYIKKDNESGALYGGNKVRKLEFLFGDALAHGAKGVLTVGYAGSNHTCATAMYAHEVGLRCMCMHIPQIPTAYSRRNILLSMAYGAELHLYATWAQREIAIHARNKIFHKETGTLLYDIPSGGSNEIGALGFVNAIYELKEQIAQGVMPEPDYIYVAIGSVGTAAGLRLGVEVAGLKSTVVPVCIEPELFEGEHVLKLSSMIRITSEVLHRNDPSFPVVDIKPTDIPINYNFIGKGYAYISQPAHTAIHMFRTAEGVKLDGTYTGKACAAMLSDLVCGKLNGKTVLFWDSFCDRDYSEVTDKLDYHQLPQAYHHYFECALQPDDEGL